MLGENPILHRYSAIERKSHAHAWLSDPKVGFLGMLFPHVNFGDFVVASFNGSLVPDSQGSCQATIEIILKTINSPGGKFNSTIPTYKM